MIFPLFLALSLSFSLLAAGQAAAESNLCQIDRELARAKPKICEDDPSRICCLREKEHHDKDSYLRADEMELSSILPPPPLQAKDVERSRLDANRKEGPHCPREATDADLTELAELRRIRDGSSPAEEIKACLDYDETVDRFLDEAGAEKLDENRVDKRIKQIKQAVLSCRTEHKSRLFLRISDTVSVVTNSAKKSFCRCRPYSLDKDLAPVKAIDPGDSYSYPSGHATYGTLIGLVLADLQPLDKEWRSAMYRRMEDFGYSRLISRVHYRSDVYAGHLAGEHIYAKLQKTEEFVKDFQAIESCLKKALGT